MPLTDLTSLQSEFVARGFDYITSGRQTDFINRAYQDLAEEEDWPFLQATVTGTVGASGLALTTSGGGIRTIESVIDTTNKNKLVPLDRRNVTDYDPDTTTTGTPLFYWVEYSAQTTYDYILKVYPANTATSFSVRGWISPNDLSGSTDVPIIPPRWRDVIIDKAVAYAYFDSDNFEAAQGMIQQYESALEGMRTSYMGYQHDQPASYIVANDIADGTLLG